MTYFDPNEHKREGSDRDSTVVPAGEYLVAMRWFQRRESNADKAVGRRGTLLRCRYQILYGPAKGRSFFSTMSLDITKDGSVARLSLFCNVTGIAERFDTTNNADIERLFLNRPFKIRVKVKDGQYPENDIERYLFKLSDAEREAADRWVMEQAERQHDEEDARAARGGGSSGDFGGDDSDPGWSDDDIPF